MTRDPLDIPTPVHEAVALLRSIYGKHAPNARTVYRYVEKRAIRVFATPGGRLRIIPRDCAPRERETSSDVS